MLRNTIVAAVLMCPLHLAFSADVDTACYNSEDCVVDPSRPDFLKQVPNPNRPDTFFLLRCFAFGKMKGSSTTMGYHTIPVGCGAYKFRDPSSDSGFSLYHETGSDGQPTEVFCGPDAIIYTAGPNCVNP